MHLLLSVCPHLINYHGIRAIEVGSLKLLLSPGEICCFCLLLDMEGEGYNSEIRTDAAEERGSDETHSAPIGRPIFVFLPPEVKFDGGNMFEWSKMITLTLDGSQLGDHLTEAPVLATDPEYKTWKAKEASILGWMLRSMTPEMRRDFLYCSSVKELWEDIQKYSEDQIHHWRIYELYGQAAKTRQGMDNVMQYSSKLKAIWREIDYLWPTQNPQSVEREYILMQRLFAFLNGLNDVYENVRSQLLHREKLPSLEEAIGAIRQAESRLRVTTKRPENRVLPGGSGTPRSPQSNSVPATEGDVNRDSLFCTYCKKRRHTKENCWKLAWKNQNLSKKAYATSTQAQSSQIAVTSPQVEEVQERLSSTALVKSGNSSILALNG